MVTYMRSECDPLDIGFRYVCVLCLTDNNMKEYRPNVIKRIFNYIPFHPE